MFRRIFIVILGLGIAMAEDLSQGSEGTNMELSNGWDVNTVIDASGKPVGSVYAYLGGKMSQVQGQQKQQQQQQQLQQQMKQSYFQSDDTFPPADSGPSSLMNHVTAGAYFVAGFAAAVSIWYICALVIKGAKSTGEMTDELKTTSNKEKETTEGTEEPTAGETGEKKSRKTRSVSKVPNDELTRLANLVLSAVQSGECLQQSICYLGEGMSDMAGKKGKMTDSILSTLLPSSVQQSDYYLVMRKALRGEADCERFQCTY